MEPAATMAAIAGCTAWARYRPALSRSMPTVMPYTVSPNNTDVPVVCSKLCTTPAIAGVAAIRHIAKSNATAPIAPIAPMSASAPPRCPKATSRSRSMCISPRIAGTRTTRLTATSNEEMNHWSRLAATVASCLAAPEWNPGETMKPTSPTAGATIMHAPATVFRNRCGSAEPNMYNLLVVDPSMQGKTLLRADRYSCSLPNVAMQRNVRATLGPHVHQPGCQQVGGRPRLHVREAERGRERGQVEARRRGHVLLEDIARAGHRQELEDAAAAVVEHD